MHEADGGLPETSAGGSPYRRSRFTTVDMPGARTEQLVAEWTDEQGRISRLDGPARVWADGTVEHWVSGLRHRDKGPAIEYPRPYGGHKSGPDEYWLHGRRHRTDGPAREAFRDSFGERWGTGEYFLEGKLVPDVRNRWSVLRHYTAGSSRPSLDVDNEDAWDLLLAGGSVDRCTETIEPTALAAALRVHPN